jgi:hypothetical protein
LSVFVHAFPSLQPVPSIFAGVEQTPVVVLQVPTSWHWSNAVHTTGLLPLHTPAWQVSVCVHAFPSLQLVPSAFAGFEQTPVAGLHVPAVWHWSGAGHTTGLLPLQAPAWQVSVCVHAFPSLHETVLFVCTHPVAALQLSSVQGFPSLQSGAGPPVQTSAAEHVSAVVQALLSLQATINWHLSVPSHFPVLPQEAPVVTGQVAGVVVCGPTPPAIFEHVPRPSVPDLQLWQPSLQWSVRPEPTLQQTPSAEQTNPAWQSVSALQIVPLPNLSPQVLLVLRQVSLLQLRSDEQVLRHVGLVVLQTYDPHDSVVGAGHAPFPSQVAGKVWVLCVLPLAQLSCRQPVPLGQGRQAPAPLHVPSRVQSPLATSPFLQRDLGSVWPLSTKEQVPAGPACVPLQDLHRPPEGASEQALLQHTPSVQNPLRHWVAAVHAAPSPFRPQELFAQVLGGAQSVSLVQVVLHAPESHAKVTQPWVAGAGQVPFPSHFEANEATDALAQTASLQPVPLM